ncbi:MAG: efflux RND transporter periplasmic adaptor subunit [Rickettsiales bacterium]|jgi:multidrug efflux system membrane fusion protein|nr:efflux RND transporter periplasmic adaptor subunit [Rickettsiales bacterium]
MIRKLKARYMNSRLGQKHPKVQAVVFFMAALVLWFALGMLTKSAPKLTPREDKLMKVGVRVLHSESATADILVFGHTLAEERVELKTRTAGTIEKILKPKGSRVKKGETILRLGMEDRQARLVAAKTEVEWQTAQELMKKGLISKVEYIAAEAAYKQASLDVEYANIKAPFDGVVGSLDYEEGAYIPANTHIGLFLNLATMKIVAELPEKYVSRARIGSVAAAKIADGSKIDAALMYIAPAANSSTRTFSLEFIARNNGRISEGMTAEVRLPLDAVMASRLPSSSCLTFGDDGRIGVKALDDGDKVEFYPVELVKDEDVGLWVSGLPDKASVIVSGQEFVRTGEKVEPKYQED